MTRGRTDLAGLLALVLASGVSETLETLSLLRAGVTCSRLVAAGLGVASTCTRPDDSLVTSGLDDDLVAGLDESLTVGLEEFFTVGLEEKLKFDREERSMTGSGRVTLSLWEAGADDGLLEHDDGEARFCLLAAGVEGSSLVIVARGDSFFLLLGASGGEFFLLVAGDSENG